MEIEGYMVELINNVCNDLDIKVYPNYSGRGMYNQQCLGFIIPLEVSEIQLILGFIKSANMETYYDDDEFDLTFDIIFDDIEQMFDDYKIDNLGLDRIIYLPRYTINENHLNLINKRNMQ